MPTLRTLRTLIFALLTAAVLSGCVAASVGLAIRVPLGPPGFHTEVLIASPGPGYVWVPGYWDWRATTGDYFWIEGRWLRPPHPRAVWEPPRYERRRGGWIYLRGHWR